MDQKPFEGSYPVSKQGFMTLVPKGKGFPGRNSGKQSTDTHPDTFLRLEEYLDQLLHDCGYRSNDRNEREQVLYIKTLFILRKVNSLKASSDGKALLLLAADQECLFKDADPISRNRMQNMKFLKAQRERKEALSAPRKRNPLIEEVVSKANCINGEQAELAKLLMKEILKDSGKRGIYRWVFSSQHIGLNDSNRAEYQNKFVCFQEQFGGLPADASLRDKILEEWLHDDLKVQKLIELCCSLENPNDIGLLDLSSLEESCRKLLEKAEAAIYLPVFADHFFFDFVYFVLREYMVQLNIVRNYATPVSLYRSTNESEFRNFEKRYNRLCKLQTKFYDYDSLPFNETLASISCWEFPSPLRSEVSENLENSDRERRVVDAICAFFTELGIPLADDHGNLQTRIQWILRRFGKDSSLLPIIILLMVMCCGNRVTSSRDLDTNMKRPSLAFQGINHAKQRYEELRLLESLFCVFKTTEEERIQNWSEYLKLREKQICSRDEYVFGAEFFVENMNNFRRSGFSSATSTTAHNACCQVILRCAMYQLQHCI